MNPVKTSYNLCLYVFAGVLCLSMLALAALAQQGENAACTSASGCSGTVASAAFLDASAFCTVANCGTGTDLCTVVNNALLKLPPAGGVVDARGINSGGSNSCNTTMPYTGISAPSVLLLPSGTIQINTTWVIPDHSRLVGQGNNPSGSPVMGTYIIASGMSSSATMMEMGSSSCDDGATGQCYGISISNLTLSGADGLTAPNNHLVGISNVNSGENSYVDHVNLQQFGGTSLIIGGLASGSGPYADIAVNPMGECTTTTVGIQLGDATGELTSTRGIHGLTATCPVGSTSGGTGEAILLDAPNNTLEDMHFEGFVDGILVGSVSPTSGSISTSGNVFININGGSTPSDDMSNIVRVCSPSNPSGSACGNASNTVTDLTMIGVLATHSCTPGHCYSLKNVVEDDLTNTNIPFVVQLATSVGLYVIGEPSPGGSSGTYSYSKFSNTPITGTSPANSISTWQVGALGSSSPGNPCQPGSLFSNTTGTGTMTNTIWACNGGSWSAIK